ncbi:hypothetical protein KC19_N010200 [Ceratodon purpureus]|nr:hypothetical protein KC19_N010200 [Ceratodon purpureus]KAG0504608.1 hypothetical protein KC19_N010200 [Ceratodon purpureus]
MNRSINQQLVAVRHFFSFLRNPPVLVLKIENKSGEVAIVECRVFASLASAQLGSLDPPDMAMDIDGAHTSIPVQHHREVRNEGVLTPTFEKKIMRFGVGDDCTARMGARPFLDWDIDGRTHSLLLSKIKSLKGGCEDHSANQGLSETALSEIKQANDIAGDLHERHSSFRKLQDSLGQISTKIEDHETPKHMKMPSVSLEQKASQGWSLAIGGSEAEVTGDNFQTRELGQQVMLRIRGASDAKRTRGTEHAKRTRSPNWTFHETQALLEVKAKALHVVSGRPWKYISDYLRVYDYDRSAKSCQACWDNLLKKYRAIKFHEGASLVSYWEMDEVGRSQWRLPRLFFIEWWDTMNMILAAREKRRCSTGPAKMSYGSGVILKETDVPPDPVIKHNGEDEFNSVFQSPILDEPMTLAAPVELRNSGFVTRKIRRFGETNWSAEEKFALLKLKEEFGTLKGTCCDFISQNLKKRHGYERSPKWCQLQWDAILKDYKVISNHEYLQRSNEFSYWKMDEHERARHKLPRHFPKEWHTMVRRIINAADGKRSGKLKSPIAIPAEEFLREEGDDQDNIVHLAEPFGDGLLNIDYQGERRAELPNSKYPGDKGSKVLMNLEDLQIKQQVGAVVDSAFARLNNKERASGTSEDNALNTMVFTLVKQRVEDAVESTLQTTLQTLVGADMEITNFAPYLLKKWMKDAVNTGCDAVESGLRTLVGADHSDKETNFAPHSMKKWMKDALNSLYVPVSSALPELQSQKADAYRLQAIEEERQALDLEMKQIKRRQRVGRHQRPDSKGFA